MVQLLNEILQLQMIHFIKLLAQIHWHETIEICLHHSLPDVASAALIAYEIAQRNRAFDNLFTVINA